MEIQIAKWGNSLGIRIPRPLADQLGLEDGGRVNLSLTGDSIVLRKKKYVLDDLVSQITPENMHKEINWGDSVGKEIW